MFKEYKIVGGNKLSGTVSVAGSKNVVLKALIAACLTQEKVVIHNVPLITDFNHMAQLVKEIGGMVELHDHSATVQVPAIKTTKLSLEYGAKIRTSSMFLAPLLARSKKAAIPNPGGCRIGARPINRHIDGLETMGAKIGYAREDGYFYAETNGLKGARVVFEKNTHTGTETIILAAVLAEGITVIENAAEEPEVDDLIQLLIKMGAKISRNDRTIRVEGVAKLSGAEFSVMPDRNEVVTYAVASALTGGGILITNAQLEHIRAFINPFQEAGGAYEETQEGVRFYIPQSLKAVDITVMPHPGFMTDWQGVWAVLMTQAEGSSVIHETVYENRFGYVSELQKMGAKIMPFTPDVKNPKDVYNFNYSDEKPNKQAIRIDGSTTLHNAVMGMTDLRAGATLVLAALIATGESIISGVEHLERGYESFDTNLKKLGANIEVFTT